MYLMENKDANEYIHNSIYWGSEASFWGKKNKSYWWTMHIKIYCLQFLPVCHSMLYWILSLTVKVELIEKKLLPLDC